MPAPEKPRAVTPAAEMPAEPNPPEAPKSTERREATPQHGPSPPDSPKVKTEGHTDAGHALLTRASPAPTPAPIPVPIPAPIASILRAASEFAHGSSSSTPATSSKSSHAPTETQLTEPPLEAPASRPTVDVANPPTTGAACGGGEQPAPQRDTAEGIPPPLWQEDLKSLRGWLTNALDGVAARLTQQVDEKNSELSKVVGRQGEMVTSPAPCFPLSE